MEKKSFFQNPVVKVFLVLVGIAVLIIAGMMIYQNYKVNSVINKVFDFSEEQDENLSKASDSLIISTLAGSRATAETYYDESGLSYKGLCDSPDLNKDFAEVNEHTVMSVVCNVSETGKDYAISAKLESGQYFCIDSMGIAKKTDVSLGVGTVCQ